MPYPYGDVVYAPGLTRSILESSNAAIDLSLSSRVLTSPYTGSTGEALLYNHPDYNHSVYKWRKYLDTYEGQNLYRYLHQHTRESDAIFTNRMARGCYYNYVSSVIDLFVAYLYHSPVARDLGNLPSPDIESIYQDADLNGNTFHIFMQMVATFAQINGHAGVLVDLPRLESEFQSEQQRLDAEHRPYLTTFQAQQIKDWELDKFNNFEWVKLELSRPIGRAWDQEILWNKRWFLIWSKEEWVEWEVTVPATSSSQSGFVNDPVTLNTPGEAPTEEDVNQAEASIVARGPNPLGVVPLVIVKNEKMPTHKWFGMSAVRDIADINIGIFNWTSLGDEEIFERCINVLALERGEGDQEVTLSHHNALEYEPGSNPPYYLEPGISPLEMIGKWVDRARNEIYRLAKLSGATGMQSTKESTSGIAYAFEFNETNQSLANKAEDLEQAETEIHTILGMWYDIAWDGRIAYAREFGVEDFSQDLEMLVKARETLTSEEALKTIEKKIAARMFSREKQQLREKIAAEIDGASLVLQRETPQETAVVNSNLDIKDLEPPKPEPTQAGKKPATTPAPEPGA